MPNKTHLPVVRTTISGFQSLGLSAVYQLNDERLRYSGIRSCWPRIYPVPCTNSPCQQDRSTHLQQKQAYNSKAVLRRIAFWRLSMSRRFKRHVSVPSIGVSAGLSLAQPCSQEMIAVKRVSHELGFLSRGFCYRWRQSSCCQGYFSGYCRGN